ncbi:hypothetical protein EI42_04715 [Thermosporothrix hazakensis]|jgi:hypothetical protein|uniref:Uncharacterized protein n=1 Tax=Thermosporothrix hazakensis TaxID=644383 RepID=A0A326U0N2_THEHA|nr:hypothetical protein EI42_04715 [Thermosporothrix hazakensis]
MADPAQTRHESTIPEYQNSQPDYIDTEAHQHASDMHLWH